jgi:ferredoxin
MARIKVANRELAGLLKPEVVTGPAVSILNALLRAGVAIRHDCGGKALCGTCALRVVEGGQALSPVRPLEAGRLAARGLPSGCRLACQAHATRDVEVEILLD